MLHYSGFGVSAMINTIGSGILVGRPYGGACILVKDSLSVTSELLLATDRAVIVRIGHYAFINVYMPCISVSSESIMDNILSEISGLINDNPNISFFFGRDMNKFTPISLTTWFSVRQVFCL